MRIDIGGLWCAVRKDWSAASGQLSVLAVAASEAQAPYAFCKHSPALTWWLEHSSYPAEVKAFSSWKFSGRSYMTPTGQAPPPAIEQTQVVGGIVNRWDLLGKVLKVADGLLAGSDSDDSSLKAALRLDKLKSGTWIDNKWSAADPANLLSCRVELPYGPLAAKDIVPAKFAVEPIGDDGASPTERDLAFCLQYEGALEPEGSGHKDVSFVAVDFGNKVTEMVVFSFASWLALSNLCAAEFRKYANRAEAKAHNDVAAAYEFASNVPVFEERVVPFVPGAYTISGRPWCPPVVGQWA